MGLYQRYLLPRLVQCACASPVVERQRRKVVPQAQGEVLEIGFGSGLNLPQCDLSRIEWTWPWSRRHNCGQWPRPAWRHRR